MSSCLRCEGNRTHLPQMRIVSMLQPAAASCASPVQRIKCITWAGSVGRGRGGHNFGFTGSRSLDTTNNLTYLDFDKWILQRRKDPQ